MKVFLKEINFPSSKHTYFKNITPEIVKAVGRTQIEQGFVLINSKHTTLGVVIQEIAEPNLLQDMLDHTLNHVHEDKRSSRVSKDYQYPTCDYLHRCQDNPYCNEIDEDYNAASHIRTMIYSHPSLVIPIQDGKLALGKYQDVAVMEFDGRDGKGKNPIRQRTIQIWIYEAETIAKL